MPKLSRHQFKELKDRWYETLKEEGFNDIEAKGFWNKPWTDKRNTGMQSPESLIIYYQSAQEFLSYCIFENEIHERIWEMHSQGFSIRQITRTINTRSYSVRPVHRIINHYRELMLFRFK